MGMMAVGNQHIASILQHPQQRLSVEYATRSLFIVFVCSQFCFGTCRTVCGLLCIRGCACQTIIHSQSSYYYMDVEERNNRNSVIFGGTTRAVRKRWWGRGRADSLFGWAASLKHADLVGGTATKAWLQQPQLYDCCIHASLWRAICALWEATWAASSSHSQPTLHLMLPNITSPLITQSTPVSLV